MLARVQFAANISFHIIFPSMTIALGWVLLFFKLRYQKTRNPAWMDAYRLWVKIFALCFALGVVSGITMSFQFGTNWPGFMKTVGNIAGPLLGYEVLSAFFLEASFLGIMLYGMKRVSQTVHTVATLLVAFGTTLSAFWILVLNSWMHTPVGFTMIDGKAFPTDWLAILFNPSLPYRLVHMLLASFITTGCLLAGVSAYRFLKKDSDPSILLTLKTGVILGAFLLPVQIVVGDFHGLNTLKHQPAKIAAMEGIWESGPHQPLRLFAIPDQTLRKNHMEITVPGGWTSLILTHHFYGQVQGLNDFEKIPPVAPVFFGFRLMVGLGLLILTVSWIALIQLRRRKTPSIWVARLLFYMTFAGSIATLAGWYVTEIGRQPWLVTGVLTTSQAVATTVSSSMIGLTLTGYLLLYVFLLTAFVSVVFALARRSVRHAPV